MIYEAVLDIQLGLIELLKAEAEKYTVDNLYRKMQGALAEKLVDLGLVGSEVARDEIKLTAACQEFCPHHVSHYLGMDVHDTTLISRNILLKEGMVITIEPGIYIPAEHCLTPNAKFLSQAPKYFRGIGVRIEDDILITRNGNKLSCDVLTSGVPKNVSDIEDIVNC